MKCKQQSPVRLLWLLPVLVFLMTSCKKEDDYYYPSVKLEFLTAQSGADGSLESIITDQGETFSVLSDVSDTRIDADSSIRIVSNYSTEVAPNGTSGATLYALLKPVSPLPQPADSFEEGVKYDPADVISIWMGVDYLNMILAVKAQNAGHLFHFIEDKVETDEETGIRSVYLSLFHDDGGDIQAYTIRAYASVPLQQYAEEGVEKVIVYFTVHTYSGQPITYEFEYIPQ